MFDLLKKIYAIAGKQSKRITVMFICDMLKSMFEGFTLGEITDVFLDPYLITLYDEKHSSEEDRFYSVGNLHGLLIIVVYHTERDGRTRIISARQAEKKLQEVYYESIKRING